MLEIIKPGNSKLGCGIGKVALPAIETCPGRGACAKVCYAAKIMKMRPTVRDYYERCQELLESDIDSYFSIADANIKASGFNIVRFHESGDFYSKEQIQGWIQLVRKHPNVRFFGYTRSWNQPDLLPLLEEFRSEMNVILFASVEDGESPPTWRTARIAAKAFTMHRDGTRTIHEPAGQDATYCLEQLNIKKTCAECQFCINPETNKTKHVVFQKH